MKRLVWYHAQTHRHTAEKVLSSGQHWKSGCIELMSIGQTYCWHHCIPEPHQASSTQLPATVRAMPARNTGLREEVVNQQWQIWECTFKHLISFLLLPLMLPLSHLLSAEYDVAGQQVKASIDGSNMRRQIHTRTARGNQHT